MTLPILVVVCGAVAGWLMWARLPRGENEADDSLESVFASALCGVFVTGCLALLLAEWSVLRPLPLAACLAMLGALLWWLPRPSPAGSLTSWRHLGALVLVGTLSIASVAPASEEVLGGRDPGTYANTAISLARQGSLRLHSDVMSKVSDEARLIFVGSVIFPGFYVENATRGEIVPQFLHLHPTYMALGYWLSGPAGALLVPPFLGVLAELAVFFFVRRVLGLAAAVIAAVVLALNLAQIWGMRNPYSEGPTQLGVFAALWCMAAAHQTQGLRWGILGGLALGTCFLARADALLLLVAILPALVFVEVASHRRNGWIAHAFVPLTILFAFWGVAHAWLFSRPYVVDLAHLVRPLWLLAGASVALCGLGLLLRRPLRVAAEWVYGHGTRVWVLVTLALCVAFALTMWLRPNLEPFAISPRRGTRTYVEETLVRVGWYFSKTGMMLGLAGVVLILRQWLVGRRHEWLPFLAPFLAFSVLYVWNHRIAPDHPWMMRRFLPVIVPGIAVAMAAATSFLWNLAGRARWATRVAAVACIGIVVAHEATMAAPFWTFREKGGVIRQVAGFARHVPARSVLLFSYPGIDHHVATPLATEWARAVLPVFREPRWDPRGERRRERFEAQVTRWLDQGREVLHLTANDANSIFVTRSVRWEEVTTFRLDVRTMGSQAHSPPRAPLPYTAHYRLMRAVSALRQPLPCTQSSLHVDGRVGGATQGFHGAESVGRERYYWAMPESRVMLAACDRTGPGRPGTVRVYAACGRTPRAGDCRVEVAINGEPAGTLRLGREFADHELPIPPAALKEPTGAIEIRFRGPTFQPSAARLPDDRVLSFQLTNVTLHH